MEINRSNYEIWFIDFLDGKLDTGQVGRLNSFLSENPDLQEELSEIMDLRLKPPEIEFSRKTDIKKIPSDISDLRFDFLCAGFVDSNLSIEEITELNAIVLSEKKRERELHLFKKLKLSPPDVSFRNKNKLLKKTQLQKAIRLTITGLSVAASIAVFITLYLNLSNENRIISHEFSNLIINEGRAQHSMRPQIAKNSVSEKPSSNENLQAIIPSVNKITVLSKKIITTKTAESEPVSLQVYSEAITPVEVLHNKDIMILNTTNIYQNNLILLSLYYEQPVEERWFVSRFLAKVFREKILREDTKDDSPIKGYEIAEVGVTGLNKLFGWQMAFEKNNDENGELKSIYFSSKILKIQAPVNKTEATY